MPHDTAMRSCEDNFKIPIAFTSKKKRIGRFEGLHNLHVSVLISEDKMLSGKGRLEPFLSPDTQGERTEIRPGKVKQLLLRYCSGLHSKFAHNRSRAGMSQVFFNFYENVCGLE